MLRWGQVWDGSQGEGMGFWAMGRQLPSRA